MVKPVTGPVPEFQGGPGFPYGSKDAMFADDFEPHAICVGDSESCSSVHGIITCPRDGVSVRRVALVELDVLGEFGWDFMVLFGGKSEGTFENRKLFFRLDVAVAILIIDAIAPVSSLYG